MTDLVFDIEGNCGMHWLVVSVSNQTRLDDVHCCQRLIGSMTGSIPGKERECIRAGIFQCKECDPQTGIGVFVQGHCLIFPCFLFWIVRTASIGPPMIDVESLCMTEGIIWIMPSVPGSNSWDPTETIDAPIQGGSRSMISGVVVMVDTFPNGSVALRDIG